MASTNSLNKVCASPAHLSGQDHQFGVPLGTAVLWIRTLRLRARRKATLPTSAQGWCGAPSARKGETRADLQQPLRDVVGQELSEAESPCPDTCTNGSHCHTIQAPDPSDATRSVKRFLAVVSSTFKICPHLASSSRTAETLCADE